MSRLICNVMFLFLIFTSNVSHSLSIENFDAFQQNDNLALRDVDTGLIWLDFGVNNGESINSVVNNLNGIYTGWRLPSESEVMDLWGRLAVSDLAGIFDFWGANKTPVDHSTYLAWAYFIDQEGYLGAAYIKEELGSSQILFVNNYYGNNKIIAGVEKKVIDVKYDGSNYYPFDLNGAAEISTLLVKKIMVKEPSLFLLFMLVFAVFMRRYLSLNS